MTAYRLYLFILVSIIIHAAFLTVMPEYKTPVPEKKPVVVDVELVQADTLPAKGKPVEGESLLKGIEGSENLIGSGTNVDLPDTEQTKDLDIEIPDIDFDNLDNPDEKIASKSVDSEILSSGDELAKELSNPVDDAQMAEPERFFKVKNSTNRKRKLLYVPKQPSFTLTQNTQVTLKFNIDKAGNTYAILLLTRTDSSIEKAASDFVKNLKFVTSDYDNSDTVEIVLYFRVK